MLFLTVTITDTFIDEFHNVILVCIDVKLLFLCSTDYKMNTALRISNNYAQAVSDFFCTNMFKWNSVHDIIVEVDRMQVSWWFYNKIIKLAILIHFLHTYIILQQILRDLRFKQRPKFQQFRLVSNRLSRSRQNVW